MVVASGIVDGIARSADAGDGPFVQQAVGVRRPGDQVLAAACRHRECPASPRPAAVLTDIGVVVVDARHRIALPDQVAVRRGIDPHAVAAVAGDGLAVGQQADVVALDRDVRGAERDPRVAGLDQRERLEGRSVGAGGEFEPLGTLKIHGHDRRSGKRRGRGAVDGHGIGDRGERRPADPDRPGDIKVDRVGSRCLLDSMIA